MGGLDAHAIATGFAAPGRANLHRDNTRVIHLPGQPDRAYWRGSVTANDGFLADLPADLMAEPTIPAGHSEGFHDAFARLHRCFEADVRAYLDGKPFACDGSKYASVDDGVAGMRFIARAVESSGGGGAWVTM